MRISLQILPLYQTPNPLFQVRRLHRKLELRHQFIDQQRVTERFSSFHDAHNCCINLVLAVLNHTLVGFFVFLHSLLELDGVDFDPVLAAVKGAVDLEDVCVVYITPRRDL